MAENLEPLNIDINMRQNVSEESERASRGMDNLTNASKTLKEQIETQRKVVADLEKQYAQAKAAFDKVNIGTNDANIIAQREKASKLFREVRAELNAEKQGLSELEKELNKVTQAQDKASNSSVSYMTQMRKIRQEIQELAMAGKQESTRYRELEAELARVGTAYNRVRAEQRLLTTAGNAHLAGLMQGMTGMAGVFSAGQGAASLFVKNNEQLAVIQTKLQAAMAITIGLQQVSNTLHATSAFRINTVAKLTNMWRSAQMMLNTQLGISLALSKGLMIGGIGLIIAGIAALVYKYREWNKEQERTKQLQKEELKVYREANNSISEQIIRVQALEKILKDSNKSYNQRNNALNELKSIMPEYNAHLSKEGQLIEDNTGALKRYIKEIKNAAFAKAAVDKLVKVQSQYDEWLDNLSDVDKAILKLNADDLSKTGFDASGQWKDLTKQQISHLKEISKWEGKVEEYVKDNLDTVEDRTKDYWLGQQKNAQARLAMMKDYEKGSEKWNAAVSDYNTATSKLRNWDIKGQNRDADKAAKAAKASDQLKKKQTLQEIRAAENLEMQIYEAEIKAMDEGSKKVLAQMELEHRKQQQALQRQQEDALKAKKDNARALFDTNPDNKGKIFDDSAIKLSDDEIKKYTDLQAKSDEAYRKDKLTLELQYMRDYIKEYGTFQQKKLAIAQQYDKKIAASANEWDKRTLENQKKAALSAVDFEAVNKRIDWHGVFGNLTGMLDSQIKDLLDNLKEYVKTDQFRDSSDTDKKTVYESIEKLRSSLPGGEGTLNFSDIQKQMEALGAAVNRLQEATVNEKTAYENLAKAQTEYDKALKAGNQTLIDAAELSLDAAKATANETSRVYQEAEANVQNLGSGFKETAADTIDGLNLVADGLNNFASNSLPQIFKGLQSTLTGLSKLNIGGKVGEAIGSLSKALSNAAVIGQIISAVLSILDVLKDGIGTLISGLIDTVLGSIDGILKNILSFDITKQIAGSLKTGIGNILNTLSFGGFNSLVSSINGGNAKETARTISRLTASNEALKVSVDALKDEMAGTNGAKSIQAYNDAVEAQRRYGDNLQKILDTQMKYSNAHHSNAYYWNLDTNSLKEVNKLLGTSLNNTWSDFSKLTADQMNEIRKHLPDIWSEMINQGKYGDRFKDDWNNYADQAGKVAEMTESLRENIAQISFDSLRDSFVNTLMDMDSDAEDFANNFEEYLTKALLNFAVGDLLDSKIKKWYESWTDTINKQNGKLTDAQIEQQKKEWEEIVKEGIAIRDNITGSTGYTGQNDGKRSGTKVSLDSASQDSIDELRGGVYAIRQQIGDIRNLEKESVLIQRTQQASLNRLVENTEFCRYLLDVKNSLEDIQARGIKVKV